MVLADVPPERKPERGHVRQNHPFTKPPFYLPMTLFGVDKRVVSKRVVSADVPPERKPERGYVRQNHPFTKPPFYLPVNFRKFHICCRRTPTIHFRRGALCIGGELRFCRPSTSVKKVKQPKLYWELVDPIVADPVEQDNDKRNNMQTWRRPRFLRTFLPFWKGKNSFFGHFETARRGKGRKRSMTKTGRACLGRTMHFFHNVK